MFVTFIFCDTTSSDESTTSTVNEIFTGFLNTTVSCDNIIMRESKFTLKITKDDINSKYFDMLKELFYCSQKNVTSQSELVNPKIRIADKLSTTKDDYEQCVVIINSGYFFESIQIIKYISAAILVVLISSLLILPNSNLFINKIIILIYNFIFHTLFFIQILFQKLSTISIIFNPPYKLLSNCLPYNTEQFLYLLSQNTVYQAIQRDINTKYAIVNRVNFIPEVRDLANWRQNIHNNIIVNYHDQYRIKLSLSAAYFEMLKIRLLYTLPGILDVYLSFLYIIFNCLPFCIMNNYYTTVKYYTFDPLIIAAFLILLIILLTYIVPLKMYIIVEESELDVEEKKISAWEISHSFDLLLGFKVIINLILLSSLFNITKLKSVLCIMLYIYIIIYYMINIFVYNNIITSTHIYNYFLYLLHHKDMIIYIRYTVYIIFGISLLLFIIFTKNINNKSIYDINFSGFIQKNHNVIQKITKFSIKFRNIYTVLETTKPSFNFLRRQFIVQFFTYFLNPQSIKDLNNINNNMIFISTQ